MKKKGRKMKRYEPKKKGRNTSHKTHKIEFPQEIEFKMPGDRNQPESKESFHVPLEVELTATLKTSGARPVFDFTSDAAKRSAKAMCAGRTSPDISASGCDTCPDCGHHHACSAPSESVPGTSSDSESEGSEGAAADGDICDSSDLGKFSVSFSSDHFSKPPQFPTGPPPASLVKGAAAAQESASSEDGSDEEWPDLTAASCTDDDGSESDGNGGESEDENLKDVD